MTDREIEKLRAIGYEAKRHLSTDGGKGYWTVRHGERDSLVVDPSDGKETVFYSEAECWRVAKDHAQAYLKDGMADKVLWLIDNGESYMRGGGIFIRRRIGLSAGTFRAGKSEAMGRFHDGDSPEAAVDALFWKVA